MYIGSLLYNMDLEIIVQTMLYDFRDDEHNTKIENLSIFFQTTFRVLVSYLLFLNSMKKKKTALLPKVSQGFFFYRANAVPYNSAHFGQGTGPIVYDGIECRGSETDLYDCPHDYIGHHNCEHYEDAGVTCGRY